MIRLPVRFLLARRGFLTVAAAAPADAALLLNHARQVARESDFLSAGPGERALTLAAQVAFLRRLKINDTGFVLKGTISGRLVAVLSVVRPNQPRLRHRAEFGLAVRAAHWGHGIGRRMGEVAIALAADRGLRKLNLCLRADNRRALALYQTLGFSREGSSPRALCVHGRFFAEVMMGLCLPTHSRVGSPPASPAAHHRGRVWRGRAPASGAGAGREGAEGRSEPSQGSHVKAT